MTIVDCKMNKNTNINIGERHLYIIINFLKISIKYPPKLRFFSGGYVGSKIICWICLKKSKNYKNIGFQNAVFCGGYEEY